MSRSNFSDHQPGYFIPLKPAGQANFRRWNLIVIWSLVFVVLGVFAMALVPQPGHAFFATLNNVPLKIDKNPRPVNLTELRNGYASVIDPALPAVVNISSTKVVKQANVPGFF